MENAQSVSYIMIHALTPGAKMLYLSPSVTQVLGYEPSEIIGTSLFDRMHPDEVDAARKLHYETIRYEKAAVVAYLRIRNQEDCWVHCVLQLTMAHNTLIGSISLANPGAKALHTAATAQEVIFLTPQASRVQRESRKWNDPIPSPPPAIPAPQPAWDKLFRTLPMPSKRTGLLLDRFSIQCKIIFCTNNCILPAASVYNRSFYDFVSPNDETNVRSLVEVSKGWGISDSGHPSDGGFVFGSFKMCLGGRNNTVGDPTRVSGRSNAGWLSKTYLAIDELAVDAIFSAHSDAFIVILRLSDEQGRVV